MALRTSIAAILAAFILTGHAAAHEWYEDKRNPVTTWGCCGVVDCHPIAADRVKLEVINGVRGYRWLDAPDYANGWIPEDQLLPSQNAEWHVCWRSGMLVCLFIPLGA